jgi:eukaryotic-like serine/threonine-protein kinase
VANSDSKLEQALSDRYILERELGRGGMATVYLARDLRHDRHVALKVLHPDLAATLGPDRFLREIKLAARLQHPHILAVHDSGDAAGRLWFTMPYVEGESLRERLNREGQLPVEDAVRITREAGQALDYAHGQGVIHRDIKPENMLLTRDGNVLVADFGIARALGPEEQLTATGLSVGTPAYMSPEQAAGERTVDARSDIYSLACVLYEMLAGEPPFTGPTAQAIIAKRFSGEVPSVRRVRPAVPQAIEAMLHQALAQLPADRFRTMAQFAGALTSATTSPGQPTAVTPTVRRTSRQRRVLGAAIALGLGLVLGTGALFAWLRSRPAGDPDAPKRLVVLPFENLGQPEQEYFAAGVTDEIATRLAAVSGLGVISRRSAMDYKSTRKPLTQVGAELGVAYVLEGTVRWDRSDTKGGRVRVTPQLVQVDGDRQLWAKSFDVDLSDVFGVQRQIADDVARALGVTLLPADSTALNTMTTANLAAYDAYLRGNAAFYQIASTAGNVGMAEAAIAAYREAVRLDPGLALAWARLAQSIAPLLGGAPTTPQADAQRASEAARRAVALAPDLPESQLALAAVTSGKANKQALKRAYTLAPADPQVLQALARRTAEAGPHEYDVLVFRGVDTLDARWRCRASLQLLQHATALDPRSIPVLRGLYGAYRCLGDIDRAEAALNQAIEIAPQLAEQWQFKAELQLRAGGLEPARAVLREAKQHMAREPLVAYMAIINDQYWVLEESDQRFLLSLSPAAAGGDSMGWALALAHTLAHNGKTVRARAYADTALQVIRHRPGAKLAVYEAMALAYLGRRDEALAVLRRDVKQDPGETETTAGWGYNQLQVVRTYNILGDQDRAVAAFENFVRRSGELLPLSPYWRLDPISAPLRGHERFERLFRQRGSDDQG